MTRIWSQRASGKTNSRCLGLCCAQACSCAFSGNSFSGSAFTGIALPHLWALCFQDCHWCLVLILRFQKDFGVLLEPVWLRQDKWKHISSTFSKEYGDALCPLQSHPLFRNHIAGSPVPDRSDYILFWSSWLVGQQIGELFERYKPLRQVPESQGFRLGRITADQQPSQIGFCLCEFSDCGWSVSVHECANGFLGFVVSSRVDVILDLFLDLSDCQLLRLHHVESFLKAHLHGLCLLFLLILLDSKSKTGHCTSSYVCFYTYTCTYTHIYAYIYRNCPDIEDNHIVITDYVIDHWVFSKTWTLQNIVRSHNLHQRLMVCAKLNCVQRYEPHVRPGE